MLVGLHLLEGMALLEGMVLGLVLDGMVLVPLHGKLMVPMELVYLLLGLPLVELWGFLLVPLVVAGFLHNPLQNPFLLLSSLLLLEMECLLPLLVLLPLLSFLPLSLLLSFLSLPLSFLPLKKIPHLHLGSCWKKMILLWLGLGDLVLLWIRLQLVQLQLLHGLGWSCHKLYLGVGEKNWPLFRATGLLH